MKQRDANYLPDDVYTMFAGSIDQYAVTDFYRLVTRAVNGGVKRVHLLIQSGGGTAHDAYAIYNLLKNAPFDVFTYCEGAVMSGAVLIYLAGIVRHAAANAWFLLHNGAVEPKIRLTSFYMNIFQQNMSREDAYYHSLLREYIDMPEENWNLMQVCDVKIGAEEALEYGLVHNIGHFIVPPGVALLPFGNEIPPPPYAIPPTQKEPAGIN